MPSQTNQSFSRSRPLAVTLKVSQRLRTNTDFPHFCVAAVPASSWTCLPYICYITVSTNDGNYMWLNENTLKAQEMINKDPHMPWRQHQWAMYSKQIKGMFGFILHWGESSQSTNKSLNTQNMFISILQLLHILLLHRPALCCEGSECSIWPCWGKENKFWQRQSDTWDRPEVSPETWPCSGWLTRVWLRGPGSEMNISILNKWRLMFPTSPHCQIIQHPPSYETGAGY